MAERVSHKPWGSFSESDYTLEQLARASLIHMKEPPESLLRLAGMWYNYNR